MAKAVYRKFIKIDNHQIYSIKWVTNKEFAAVLSSEDTKEGLTAFIEKRPPNWQGK